MCVSGHPEAARPDVQPSGLRGEALSLTLQTLNNAHRSLRLMSPLHREHSARGFNQGLGIWGAELFMPVLAPDQRTWYKMQISIGFLEVAPVCLCHKVEGGEWQFPWIRTQKADGRRQTGWFSGEFPHNFKLHQTVKCFYIWRRG